MYCQRPILSVLRITKMPNIAEPHWLSTILVMLVPFIFAIIHINIAIYLYRYAKEYNEKHTNPLFFMHPITLSLTGLIFGLLAVLLTSLVLSIERRN